MAQAAQLSLTDEEEATLCSELGELYRLAEVLQNAPVNEMGEELRFSSVTLSQLREDVVGECLSPDEAFASQTMVNSYVRLPRVVEK